MCAWGPWTGRDRLTDVPKVITQSAGGRAGSSGCLPLPSLGNGAVFWILLERGPCSAGRALRVRLGYWGGRCRREPWAGSRPGLPVVTEDHCFFCKTRWGICQMVSAGDLRHLWALQTGSMGCRGLPSQRDSAHGSPVGRVWVLAGRRLQDPSGHTGSLARVPTCGQAKASEGVCLWSQLCKVINIRTSKI